MNEQPSPGFGNLDPTCEANSNSRRGLTPDQTSATDVQITTVRSVSKKYSDQNVLLLGQRPLQVHVPGERFELGEEIARGGMGSVIRGFDNDIHREIAIKILLSTDEDIHHRLPRFVEEAQIGGQLQHPGIAPVYELGRFSDGRSFFAMKLVRGDTLAMMLSRRNGNDHSQLIDVFEQICLALAYAHSRNVIHRDLKPANVMVGAFGEVQVMDWGLAKILNCRESSVDDSPKSDHSPLICSIRSEDRADASDVFAKTIDGSVMGTFAYMPTEQALGLVNEIDERADVFGLGAILCEILTGDPPYLGKSSWDKLELARGGKIDDALHRLDACGAEPMLISIAKHCLMPKKVDRPRHAGIVAEAITQYLQNVRDRLHKAEQASIIAKTQAAEEMKRRRLTLILAGSILFFMTLGAAGLIFSKGREARLAQEKNRLMAERIVDADKIRAQNKKISASNAELEQANLIASEQRHVAERTLADSQTSRGIFTSKMGADDEAPLWFCAAAASIKDDPDRVRANRIRARNWMRLLPLPVRSLPLPYRASLLRRIEFQPGGDLFLIQRLGDLMIWDWRRDRFINQRWGDVEAARWSEDGQQLLVYGKQAGVLKSYDTVTWESKVIDEAAQIISALEKLEYSPQVEAFTAADGRKVVLSKSKQLQILSDEEPHPSLNGSGGPIYQHFIVSPSRRFVVGVMRHDGYLLDFGSASNSNAKPKIIALSQGEDLICDVAFSGDETTFITVGRDQSARQWHLPDGRSKGIRNIDTGVILNCAIDTHGLRHATVLDYGTLRIYEGEPPLLPQPLNEKFGLQPRFSIDQRYVVPSCWHQDCWQGVEPIDLSVYDRQKERMLNHFQYSGRVVDSVVNEATDQLVAATVDGNLALIYSLKPSTNDGSEAVPREIKLERPPLALASRSGTSEVAVLLDQGRVDIIDVEKEEIVRRFPIENWRRSPRAWPTLRYAADGNLLVVVTGGTGNHVEVLDAESGIRRYAPLLPVVHDGLCRMISISASGRLLATGVNGNNAAQVWDLPTGHPVCSALPHPGDSYGIYCVAFSPDESRIVTGNKDGRVRVWDFRAETLAGSTLQHDSAVWSVAFTDDGQYLVTGTRGGDVSLWHLRSGQLIAPPVNCGDCVVGLAMARGSSELFVTTTSRIGTRSTPKLFRLDIGSWLSGPSDSLTVASLKAEIASGKTLVEGSPVVLDADSWENRLKELKLSLKASVQ